VAKQKIRITNWHTYNKARINRGSMTFWLDDETIKAWYDTARLQHAEDLSAILTLPSLPFW